MVVSSLSILAVVLAPRAASATYSIAATDSASRQVGGSITSCVGSLDVGVVYGGVPGKGVVHAQATLDPQRRGKNTAIMQLGQDTAPSAIIAQITQSSFDPGFQSRQYGIVDLQGRSAGFSGTNAQAYKEDRQGTIGTFTYSVQGNILTSKNVIDNSESGFRANGCDLADRLMLALEAGAMNGEGDSRCTPNGIPANSAYIEVDEENQTAGSYLKLTVTNTSPMSAVTALRAKFDAWRMTHPCPAPDAGAPMDSGASMDGSLPGDASADAGPPPMGGGGCSTSGAPPPRAWLLAALAILARRRQRARKSAMSAST